MRDTIARRPEEAAMFRRDQWLHPATVLAALALMFSVGGVSYAAATIGTAQIKNKAVTGKKLANGAVTAKKIRDGAVVASELGAGVVGAAALADGGVITQKLSDGAITSSKLAGGSVGTGTLADEAVSTGKIAAQAVTAQKIADGAVTGAAIADGSVGLADLDAGTVGDILSKAGTMPNDGTQRVVLTVAGFGEVRLGCTATTANAFYSLDSPITQRAHLFGHDPLDNNPVGAVSLNGTSGGLGFGGAMNLQEVRMWSSTDDRVLAVDISVSAGATCGYRVRATLDRNGP